MYPSPVGVLYLGPVPRHRPNAPNTLKQELICEVILTLDIFFQFFLNQQILGLTEPVFANRAC